MKAAAQNASVVILNVFVLVFIAVFIICSIAQDFNIMVLQFVDLAPA